MSTFNRSILARRVLPGIVIVMSCAHAAFAQSFLFSKTFQSTTTTGDAALAVAAVDGTIYVGGQVGGSLPGLSSAGLEDAFLKKYDSNGNEIWTRQWGNSSSNSVRSIAISGTNVYAAGADVGQTAWNGFLRKYDANGNVLWSNDVAVTNVLIRLTGVAVDASGVYVVGDTNGALPGQTYFGQGDGFVRKYDHNGGLIWTRQFADSRTEQPEKIGVTSEGVYVVGRVIDSLGADNAFVAKFNLSTGAPVWTREFGSSAFDYLHGVFADETGVYISGETQGSVFGSPAGGLDIIARKYDFAGNVAWTSQFGSSGDDYSFALTGNANGIYVIGLTNGTLPSQTSNGSIDVVIRKFARDGTVQYTSQTDIAPNQTTLVVAAGADSNFFYVGGSTAGTIQGAPAGILLSKLADSTGGGGGGGTGLRFVPVTPCRVMDTRSGQGKTGSFGPPALTGGTSRTVPIPQSGCNIPSTAQAYALNATVVPNGPLSFLTLWPTGISRPLVSTLNAFRGEVVANSAIVPAGAGGSVDVFVTDTTDVVLDIVGYFASGTGLAFYPVVPCRVVDTRPAQGTGGAFGPPSFTASQTKTFPLPQGRCNIPTNAQAYSLNMTVVPVGPLGFLTTWPSGSTQPLVSTLNSFDGRIVANGAIVPAGTSGGVNVFVTNVTDVIIDINGYFAPDDGTGLSFFAVTPCRTADTRTGQGKSGEFGPPSITGGTSRTMTLPNSGCGVPASAKAYSLNFTVVPSGPILSFLTTWPAGSAQPLVSTLNSFDGRIVANGAIVPAGTNGAISAFVTDRTDLIVDVNGYFGR